VPDSIHSPRYTAVQEHLRALRMAAGLTQVQLAAALGIEQSNLSKIERGERYVDLLFYLDWCRACGAKPAQALKALEKAGA